MKKSQRILLSTFLGFLVGIFVFINFGDYIFRMYWYIVLTQPLFELNTLITGCTRECYGMIFVHWAVIPIVFAILGLVVGLIIWRPNVDNKKDNLIGVLIILVPIFLIFVILIVNSRLSSDAPENSYFNDFQLEEPSDLYYCEADDDCAIVAEGACGCNAHGRDTAINEKYLDYWIDKQYREYGERNCLNAIVCYTEPKCIANRCVAQYRTDRPVSAP